jgi:hypothetical protein
MTVFSVKFSRDAGGGPLFLENLHVFVAFIGWRKAW